MLVQQRLVFQPDTASRALVSTPPFLMALNDVIPAPCQIPLRTRNRNGIPELPNAAKHLPRTRLMLPDIEPRRVPFPKRTRVRFLCPLLILDSGGCRGGSAPFPREATHRFLSPIAPNIIALPRKAAPFTATLPRRRPPPRRLHLIHFHLPVAVKGGGAPVVGPSE